MDGLKELLEARRNAMDSLREGLAAAEATRGDPTVANDTIDDKPARRELSQCSDLGPDQQQCRGCGECGAVDVLFTRSQFDRAEPRCKVCVGREMQAQKLQDTSIEARRALCLAAIATAKPLEHVLPAALPTPQVLKQAKRKLTQLEKAARKREVGLFKGIFSTALVSKSAGGVDLPQKHEPS
jgi:hypothetical protein